MGHGSVGLRAARGLFGGCSAASMGCPRVGGASLLLRSKCLGQARPTISTGVERYTSSEAAASRVDGARGRDSWTFAEMVLRRRRYAVMKAAAAPAADESATRGVSHYVSPPRVSVQETSRYRLGSLKTRLTPTPSSRWSPRTPAAAAARTTPRHRTRGTQRPEHQTKEARPGTPPSAAPSSKA